MDMNFNNNHDYKDDFLLYNEIEKSSGEEFNGSSESGSDDDLSRAEWIFTLVISSILTILACGILEELELSGGWFLLIAVVLFVVNTIIALAIVVFVGGIISKNRK